MTYRIWPLNTQCRLSNANSMITIANCTIQITQSKLQNNNQNCTVHSSLCKLDQNISIVIWKNMKVNTIDALNEADFEDGTP